MQYSEKSRLKLINHKISKASIKLLISVGVKYVWCHHGYAYTKLKRKDIPLHRLLMESLGHNITGLEVDHINGDSLDNRVTNLRVVTKKQNSFNVRRPTNNTTGHKGVSFNKKNNNYVAYIGKCPREHLGSFATALLAARAYNGAARKRYGRFAKLNVLPTNTE